MSAVADSREFGADAPVAVEAVCTGCQRTVEKETRTDDEGTVPTSFRHVCHRCQRVQWWNVLEVRGSVEGGDER